MDTNGITLYFAPFQERHALVTLFTQELGLVKLFIKNGQSRTILQVPFVEGSWTLIKKTSDFYYLREMNPSIYYYSSLRHQLSKLQIANTIREILIKTQQLEHPSPLLYKVVRLYLKELGHSSYPKHILSSFYLKILKHEGYLSLIPSCNQCSKPSIEDLYIHYGKFYCKEHSPDTSLEFNKSELFTLRVLTHAKSFKEIETSYSDDIIEKKIESLFHEFYSF
jgi:DNA repair protein RecO (recombination protein O)